MNSGEKSAANKGGQHLVDDPSRLSLDSNGFAIDDSPQCHENNGVAEQFQEPHTRRGNNLDKLKDDDHKSVSSDNTVDRMCKAKETKPKESFRSPTEFQPFNKALDRITQRPSVYNQREACRYPTVPDESPRPPRLSAPAARLSMTFKSGGRSSTNPVSSNKPKSPDSPSVIPRFMQPTATFLRSKENLGPSLRRVPASRIKEVNPSQLPHYMKLTEAAKSHYTESLKPVLDATNAAFHRPRLCSGKSTILREFNPDDYVYLRSVRPEDRVLLEEIRRILTDALGPSRRQRESIRHPECVQIKKYDGLAPDDKQIEKEREEKKPKPGYLRPTNASKRMEEETRKTIHAPVNMMARKTCPTKFPRYMQPTKASKQREEENQRDREKKAQMGWRRYSSV